MWKLWSSTWNIILSCCSFSLFFDALGSKALTHWHQLLAKHSLALLRIYLFYSWVIALLQLHTVHTGTQKLLLYIFYLKGGIYNNRILFTTYLWLYSCKIRWWVRCLRNSVSMSLTLFWNFAHFTSFAKAHYSWTDSILSMTPDQPISMITGSIFVNLNLQAAQKMV